MDRLEKDFLVLDLISHGAPIEYVLARLIGINIKNIEPKGGEPKNAKNRKF